MSFHCGGEESLTQPIGTTQPVVFNLFQDLLLFTDEASRGGKLAVSREAYIRNLKSRFHGVTFNRVRDTLLQLEERKLLKVEWTGPETFSVRMTEVSQNLLHPPPAPPANPPPPSPSPAPNSVAAPPPATPPVAAPATAPAPESAAAPNQPSTAPTPAAPPPPETPPSPPVTVPVPATPVPAPESAVPAPTPEVPVVPPAKEEPPAPVAESPAAEIASPPEEAPPTFGELAQRTGEEVESAGSAPVEGEEANAPSEPSDGEASSLPEQAGEVPLEPEEPYPGEGEAGTEVEEAEPSPEGSSLGENEQVSSNVAAWQEWISRQTQDLTEREAQLQTREHAIAAREDAFQKWASDVITQYEEVDKNLQQFLSRTREQLAKDEKTLAELVKKQPSPSEAVNALMSNVRNLRAKLDEMHRQRSKSRRASVEARNALKLGPEITGNSGEGFSSR